MEDSRNYRYMIYLLFLLSGVSGLVYQIVWTRMLVLVFGNTMLATSTVLSAFMGGLAAGSYVLGKYIDRRPRGLIKVYALLEAGIGLFALVFPFVLDGATPIYSALYGGIEGNIILLNLVRFAVCFAMIAVPTFLMGGTLPVLIKRFSTKESAIGHQTGFLYGLNTVGAVIGTFSCGYFMLRLLGMQKTTWVAVAINLSVAIVAWLLSRRAAEAPRSESVAYETGAKVNVPEPKYSRLTIRMVLIGIGLSGFCALAYEVFWTRMLNLFLHNNIYSFTAILGTFLVGIAVGSLIYAKYLSRLANQVRLFVWLEIGIGAISFATPYIFGALHSSLFNNFSETLTLAKTAVIMIVPTVLMGIAVPLAIQICRRGARHEGESVGSVYAVNTVGAIFGAFMAGFILLPTVGLHLGVIIVASLNVVAGFLPLISTARPSRRLVWSAGLAAVLLAMIIPAPANLFRSLFEKAHPNADIVYYKEGKVANILVYDFKKLGYKDFHLNAVNEASSRLWHVQLFKMLGLLPTLVHDNPKDALMVAFGAGMSAGAAARNVESLDCVDLNPDIQGIAAAYTRENLDVINQPNFHQIVNDGRNALLLNPRKYSLIISDATNPKMFDSWTLYSQEFYQLVKDRLEPDGVFCQWALIPLPDDAIKVILNTFRSVFPHMSVWVIHGSSQILMLGTPDRLEIDYNDLQHRLEPLLEEAGFAEFGVENVEKFLSFFCLGEDGAAKMLEGFDKISTDDLPHAQFHITQDAEGIDNCLDLVRYQESITSYMDESSPLPPYFAGTMATYEDIGRRLTIGFLTNNRLKYSEAEVVAADAGLDDANVAHALNYCPEKKRHFLAQLEKQPDDYTAHNWLGNIYRLSGEFEKAEAEFKEAIALKSNYPYARMNLALTQLERGEYDEAVSGFLAVRDISPTRRMMQSVSSQLRKSRLLRKLEFHPESAELIKALGIQYYNEGRLLDAIRAYRKAAELSGGEQSTVYNLARMLERHEFVSEAARRYNQLASQTPGEVAFRTKSEELKLIDADASMKRGWLNSRLVRLEANQPEEGEENSVDSEVHPPTCDEARILWNDVDPDGTVDLSNMKKAAQLYEESIDARPDDFHAYTDAALIYEALKDYDKAIKLWERAHQNRPDLAVIGLHIERLKLMVELESGQANTVERAVLLDRLAGYFRSVDELERALSLLRESVELSPDNAETWQSLAETAAETGRYQEAVDAAERALALNSGLHRAKAVKEGLADFL